MTDTKQELINLADVLDDLPTLLYTTRCARGLSARATARQMGISFATVSRIEMRRDHMVSSALVVLRWIGEAR